MGVFEDIKKKPTTSSSGNGVFAQINKINAKETAANSIDTIHSDQRQAQKMVDFTPKPNTQVMTYNDLHHAPEQLQSPAHNNVPKSSMPVSNYEDRKDSASRNLPVIGGVFKMLDKLSDTKFQHVVADVGKTVYTPGGSAANIAGVMGAAEKGIAKIAPGLVSNAVGRVTQKVVANAATGVPLGVGGYQSNGGDDLGEAAKSGLLGAAVGGGLGGLGGVFGEVVSKIKKDKLSATFEKMFPAYEQATKNRNVQSAVKEVAPKQTGPLLGLPEPKSTIMARELEKRSVLPANTDVIRGQGNVETMALPQGNYTPPTRLKVNNPTETLDYVMTKIKPQVMEIIEAPARRDQLIQYIQKNTGYSYKDILDRPMKELQELGQVVEDELHGNMKQIAFDVAKRQGHDLPALLEQQAPNLRAQLAKDKQSQVYGVQPPKIGIQKPNFNVVHEGNVAMPETKIGRPPLKGSAETPKAKPRATIKAFVENNEVAATTAKPKAAPIARAESVVKPPAVKPKVEVVRTPGIRANFRNQVKNGNLSSQLRGKIGNADQSYERVTNAGSVERANEAVKNLPKAESDFLLNESGGPDHIANGYRLMQKLDDLGEHSRALVVSKKLAEDLTKSGQTTQAASILSKLSPEGQLLNLVRQAEKNGKTVSVKDSVEFKAKAKIVQEKGGAGVRANQFTEILDRAAKGEPLNADDIKKMSDYLASAEKTIKAPKVVKVVDDLPNELKEPRKRDKIVSYLDEAEKEALARIKARKSTLNASLPIAEWKDHAIVVAAQLTKGSIKAATHVEDLVKLFGEEIRPVATQVFQKAQGLVKGVSSNIASNNIAKANESFKRISGQAKEVTHQEKIVEKYLKENPKVSPKDIDTLRNLAKNITKLSSDAKIDADIAMQKILNSYEKSNVWDKTLAIRYMSMLLNSGTQAINAASGPIMASIGHAADVFGSMLDIAMSQALNKPRTTTLYGTNPLKFIARYMKNLTVGGKAGFHGVNPAGIQSTNEIRGLAFPGKYNPLGWAERTLGAVAKGADYATYKSVYDSEIAKQGFLEAVSSGIKRSDRKAIKSYVEKFVNEPTEAAMLQADRIGKNTTFQRSDTTGGKVANFLNNAPPLVKPGVNAIFPFVRTPVNIASTAVTMTPAGIIKGLFQLTSKSKASQREAIRTLSLGVTGTGISAVGYYLFNLGIITGANDSGDKDVDAIREQAGKGKYRFNQSGLTRYLSALLDGEGSEAAEKAAKYQEGDHAFDYNKLQPLAFPLAIGASIGQNKDKSLISKAANAGGDAYGSLFGMSTLKGVQSVFQPSFGGTTGEKALGVPSRIAESFFKSFSPSALAQEARRQDPIVRKTPFNDGIVANTKDYFKSRTPGLSQSLPPNKTTLGLNKMNAPGFSGQYANPYKSEIAAYSQAAVIISDLIDRTGDTTLAPSAPEKKVAGKDKKTGEHVSLPIPQERYEQLQEELGQAIIIKILAIPKNDSDGKKAEKITKIYADAREKEMNKIKTELGIRVTH